MGGCGRGGDGGGEDKEEEEEEEEDDNDGDDFRLEDTKIGGGSVFCLSAVFVNSVESLCFSKYTAAENEPMIPTPATR